MPRRSLCRHQQALDFVERHHASGHVVVVVTARMQKWEPATRRWLDRFMTVPFDGPFHRQDGDLRPDVMVKREIARYRRGTMTFGVLWMTTRM